MNKDIWEEIKRFNEQFSYDDEDELSLWLTIMDEQVNEIEEHLEEGNKEKAIIEFIDCIIVGQQAALLVSDDDVDELVLDRINNISERIEEVQDKYRNKYEESEWD